MRTITTGHAIAANENNLLARATNPVGKQSYPFKEMYERGELGINEIENRRHWFDAERFKTVHAAARGEPDNSDDDWRELLLEFYEDFFDNVVGPLTRDGGLGLSDDMEFEDSSTPAHCEVVDNAGWNPDREQEPHVRQRYAQQVVALMEEILGADYATLRAAIERGWTRQKIGETQGYKDRASASACGKGMLCSALRNLTRFYRCLDRIEERGQRPQDVWPLVGVYTSPPVKYTPGYYRPEDTHFMNQAPGPIRRWPEDLKSAA